MSVVDIYRRPIGVVYSGSRRQRGAGFLGSLFRMAVPVLKTIGKKVGRRVIKGAANLAGDLIEGENFKESAKRQLIEQGKGLYSDLRKRKVINKRRDIFSKRRRHG